MESNFKKIKKKKRIIKLKKYKKTRQGKTKKTYLIIRYLLMIMINNKIFKRINIFKMRIILSSKTQF